jgi:hypothetical protein
MPFIGNKPASVPLTSADIADSIITSAKIVDGTIALVDLSATGTKDATTFLRGDNTFAVAGGANTPAVSVYMSTLQLPTNSTFTKVNYNTERLDTDSAFDTGTNRLLLYQQVKDGNYLITAQVFTSGQSNDEYSSEINIRKNGTAISYGGIATGSTSSGASSQKAVTTHTLIDLVATDYIEVYALITVNSGTPQFYHGDGATQMSIVRIVE